MSDVFRFFEGTAPLLVSVPHDGRLIPEDQRAAHQAGLERFLGTGRGAVLNKRIEVSALRSDGSEFPVELSVSGIRLRERWYAVGIVRDVTDREQALAAASKDFEEQSLESLDQAWRAAKKRVG